LWLVADHFRQPFRPVSRFQWEQPVSSNFSTGY
jgi:hypothetical protein